MVEMTSDLAYRSFMVPAFSHRRRKTSVYLSMNSRITVTWKRLRPLYDRVYRGPVPGLLRRVSISFKYTMLPHLLRNVLMTVRSSKSRLSISFSILTSATLRANPIELPPWRKPLASRNVRSK